MKNYFEKYAIFIFILYLFYKITHRHKFYRGVFDSEFMTWVFLGTKLNSKFQKSFKGLVLFDLRSVRFIKGKDQKRKKKERGRKEKTNGKHLRYSNKKKHYKT